jgi:glutathione S-transferase
MVQSGARFTLYGHWLSGPCYKVGLMLALCGLPYEYRSVDLLGGANRTDAFLAINRFGEVPVLRHGSLTLVQSNVILEYLAAVAGGLAGEGAAGALQAKEWLAWGADRLKPYIYRTRTFRHFPERSSPQVVDYLRGATADALAFLDRSLSSRPWLVGEGPTIADVGCWAPVAYLQEAGFDQADYPNISAWAARLGELRGFALPHALMPKADATVRLAHHRDGADAT